MKFAMAIDEIFDSRSDLALLEECAKILRSKGHEVQTCGRGPSNVQNYMLSHSADVMVQVAGGMCIGTLCDFYVGIRRGYYHAKKLAIPIYTKGWTKLNPDTYKPDKGAWDDTFSKNLPQDEFNTFLNKTFGEVYASHQDTMLSFSHGKSAEELMTKMLSSSTGNATGGGGQQGGTTGLDLIKQVVSDWDKYGVTLDLQGDTLKVGRAKTSEAIILNEDCIINDSITLTDFDSDTPNTVTDGTNTIKDTALVERFGTINYDEETIENKGKAWIQDMFQVALRGHNHQIDLKCLFDPHLHMGMYVKLNIPSLDIMGRYYFVTKTSIEEESCIGLTLEPAPPSRYQEVTETTVADTSAKSGGDMISIGNNLAAKYKFCAKGARDSGAKGYVTSTYEEMKKSGCGDCHAWSDALYQELNAAGIKTRIIQYGTSMAWNHRSVQVYKNGGWEDYPYRSTNISQYARNTTSKSGMYVWKDAP
jgi:hypothetical protein